MANPFSNWLYSWEMSRTRCSGRQTPSPAGSGHPGTPERGWGGRRRTDGRMDRAGSGSGGAGGGGGLPAPPKLTPSPREGGRGAAPHGPPTPAPQSPRSHRGTTGTGASGSRSAVRRAGPWPGGAGPGAATPPPPNPAPNPPNRPRSRPSAERPGGSSGSDTARLLPAWAFVSARTPKTRTGKGFCSNAAPSSGRSH